MLPPPFRAEPDRNSEVPGIVRQVEAAREFALSGAPSRARAICAAVFLDHAMFLAHDRGLRDVFIECLLLLEMTGLLIRLLRAMDGVALSVAPVAGIGSGALQLEFATGIVLTVPSLGPGAGRATRAKAASRWREAIQDAVARAGQVRLPDASAITHKRALEAVD